MKNTDIFTVDSAGGYDADDVDIFVDALRSGCMNMVECAEKLKQQLAETRVKCEKLSGENSKLKAENSELYESCVLLAGRLAELGESSGAQSEHTVAVNAINSSDIKGIISEICDSLSKLQDLLGSK